MSDGAQKAAVRTGKFPEILKLAFVDGLGIRAIARRLRVGRKTVRRILATEGERR